MMGTISYNNMSNCLIRKDRRREEFVFYDPVQSIMLVVETVNIISESEYIHKVPRQKIQYPVLLKLVAGIL